MKSVETLASEALLLPKDQRLTLAHRILSSVEEKADHEADEAWQREIKERIRKFDTGELKGIPGSEAFREIDGLLGR